MCLVVTGSGPDAQGSPADRSQVARDLPRHAEVAIQTLRQVMEVAGRDLGPMSARVVRRQGALWVTVTTGEALTPREADVVAVRILAALRRFDRSSPGIDVAFEVADRA